MKTRHQDIVLHKFVKLNNESINIICPICQEILQEPVTLPCFHRFCKSCLEISIKTLSQQCPCCRQRFCSWYRQAIKNNQLIDENCWKKIKEEYSDLLKIDDKTKEKQQRIVLSELQNNIKLSETGEIGREFQDLYENHLKEEQEAKLKEEKATKQFIIQLYNQKEVFKLPLTASASHYTPSLKENNMLVAGPSHAYQSCIGNRTAGTIIGGRGSIAKSDTSVITISSTSSPSCSSSMSHSYGLFKTVVEVVSRGKEIIKQKVAEKIFSNSGKKGSESNFANSPNYVYPTHTHKRSTNRCTSVDSNDSLKSEIRHFKPIRTAPTTPKKLNGDILRIPSVRPESAISVEFAFSPNTTSISPINPNLPRRRSAFSVVSTAAVHTLPATSTPKEPEIKRGRKRVSTVQNILEKTVIPKKIKKPEPVASTSKENKTLQNGRITRSTSLNKLNGKLESLVDEEKVLKNAIVDQQKLEQMLEQERKDFEFAKRLQKKLNNAEREIRANYGLRRTKNRSIRVNGVTVNAKNNKNIKEAKVKKQKTMPKKPAENKSPEKVATRRSMRKR